MLNEVNTKAKDLENNIKFGYVSVSNAEAITAYGKISINKIKVWILNNGGKFY